jgi:hypothetical protein
MSKIIPLEKIVLDQALDYLGKRGHFVWRNSTGMMKISSRFVKFGKSGSGDILGVEKGTGRFITIETKRVSEKPSTQQIEFMDEVRLRGGIAILAYSLDDIIQSGL